MVKKSNSTVAVDLKAIKHNIRILSGKLHEGTGVMAVVKADAYGHGAVEVARVLEDQVQAFAVNDLEEGIDLREQGIKKPVLVFGVPESYSAPKYRMHNLTATISAMEHFRILPNGTSYHLNFDTGMGRLGFHPEQAQQVAGMLEEKAELFCTGIYSHYATADTPGSELVDEQRRQFQRILGYFPEKTAVHISNTGATAFYDTQFNMVRLGIGIYGYPPGEAEIKGLKPALSWASKLVQINTIEANHTVSYGANWEAPKDGYVGVIPVGYDDGLRRNLSGKIAVRINGKKYEVVGTITMNYSMVYLRDDNYRVGTKVELLYPGCDAHEWARKAGTIPYEILTGINPRIPRDYEF